MDFKPKTSTFLLSFIGLFLLTFTIKAQEITSENYKKQFKQAIKYVQQEDVDNASKLSYKLIDFLTANRDQYKDSTDFFLSKNYWNLTNTYLWKNQELSLKYADSTINIAMRTNSPGLKQRAYSIKYYCLYDVPGYEETLDFLADECIKYSLETENAKMLGESYMHKCNSMVVLGKSNQATAFCNKAIEAFEKVADEGYLASVYNNIGNVFSKQKETARALKFYEKSHDLSLKVEPAIEISKSARNIGLMNEELKNYQKASSYYRVYGDSLQSHMDQVLKSKFAEAESKYQVEQKDKEIAQQQLEIAQAKNSRNLYIIVILIVFMLIVAYLQYRYNKQKRIKLSIENNLAKEQEINEMRTKFLGNISHEIRTPLTLISGNIQMALEKMESKKDVQKYLDMALLNSKQVIEDAYEILHVLKFEKGKQEVSYTPTEIDKFCKRVFLSFESAATDKQITLKYTSELPEDAQINIDQNKTEKIINNLVTNALKFSASESQIEFTVTKNGDWLELSIKDSGIGIHPQDQEKIFDRFYQSEKTKSIGGIGIGLALSKEFAQLMKGSLSVESELNKRSTFQLQIPYKEVVSKSLVEPTTTVSQSGNKPKILVVEDNVEMSKFLSEILQDQYDVTVSFDGADALSDEEAFDTKLLDKIQNIVIENMTNEDFKIDDLAKEIGYSQRQLSRILNEYTGMSPVKFVLEIRLQKAYQLLQKKVCTTLSEVKYDIGISSTSYFNAKFKDRFGVKPSDFLS